MTSITRDLHYRTAQPIPSRTAKALYDGLDAIFRMYNSRGFNISKIYADKEFETLMETVKDDLGVTMQYSPSQAHVPEAERNN